MAACKSFSAIKSGFSLVQTSIILAVAGILLAAMIPGTETSESEKASLTLARMQAIEAATQRFMNANMRRPCPADATLAITNASFGRESSDSGNCSSSANFEDAVTNNTTDAASSGSDRLKVDLTGVRIGMHVSGTNIPTNARIIDIDGAFIVLNTNLTSGVASGTALTMVNIAAGMVPVTTLGLPAEYALDGYGRRFMYVVDNRATEKTSCAAMDLSRLQGNIAIRTTEEDVSTYDYTPWAIISYGADGQGAYSSSGTRIDVGVTDDLSKINYFNGGLSGALVKTTPTGTFDDIVWYTKTAKNSTFCGSSNGVIIGTSGMTPSGAMSGTVATTLGGSPTGSSTLPAEDTRATLFDSNTSATSHASEGLNMANGDVNGDGIKDLVTCFTNTNKCYVLFGSDKGFGARVNTIDYNSIDGINGFTITNDLTTSSTYCGSAGYANRNFGKSVAVGDVNGDGYDDILIAGTYPALVYGGPKIGKYSYMRGGAANGTITFSRVPANNETISLNGTTWTFKTSGANILSNETNITAGNLAATLSQLASDLNASTNANIKYATYTASATTLTITAKLAGTTVHSGGLQQFPYNVVSVGLGTPTATTYLTNGSSNLNASSWYANSGNINLSSLDGFRGQLFWGGSTGPTGAVAIGNVNGDHTEDDNSGNPVNDIIFSSTGYGATRTYQGPSRYRGQAGVTQTWYGTATTYTTYIVFGVKGTQPANLAYSNLWTPSGPACLDVNSGAITVSGWHSEYPVIFLGNNTSVVNRSGLGYNTLTTGDFNGDGFDEIISGNPTFTYTTGGWALAANSGNVSMIWGRNSEWGIANAVNKKIYTIYNNALYTTSKGPYGTITYNAALPNIDGEGWPRGGTGGLTNQGAGITYHDAEGLDRFWSCTGGSQCGGFRTFRVTGQSGTYLGGSVAAGDINGDGYTDVVTTSSGSLFIYRGFTNALVGNRYAEYTTPWATPSIVCTYITCDEIPLATITYNSSMGVFGLYGAGSYANPDTTNSFNATRLNVYPSKNGGAGYIVYSNLNTANYRGTTHILKVWGSTLTSNAATNATLLQLADASGIQVGAYVSGNNIKKGTYVSAVIGNNVYLAGNVVRSTITSGTLITFTMPLMLIEGPANNSYAIVTSVADFNNDGAFDIAIGAPNYNNTSSVQQACVSGSGYPCGKTYIYWGQKEREWGPYNYCHTNSDGSIYCAAAPFYLNTLD